ncbi:MAG: hypothetical protein ACPHVZ_01585, partial [Psychrobacter sp.]
MKNLTNKLAFMTGSAFLLSAAMSTAHAEPSGYDQLTFETQVKEDIANDEVRASLYKKAQASDAKALATTLNTSINRALAIAKRYPSVTVSTG